MTSINVPEDIYFGYYEEADRRGYRKSDGKVDTVRMINETLKKNMKNLQEEILA